MNRLADTTTEFRCKLRNLRESCVYLVSFLQGISAENKLRTLVADLDSDLAKLLTEETDNDRIGVLHECISDHVIPFRGEMDGVKKAARHKLRTIWKDLPKTVQDNESQLPTNLKAFFENETVPDPATIPTSDNAKIDEMWQVLTHLSRVCETCKALETLEIPPKMSPEQVENLRLQHRLDEANKAIAARDMTIKRLQDELNRMRQTLQEARSGEATAKSLTSAVRVMPAISDEEDLTNLRLAMQKIAEVVLADTKDSLRPVRTDRF